MANSDKHYKDLKDLEESQTPEDNFEVEITDLDPLAEQQAENAPSENNVRNDRNKAVPSTSVRISLRSRLALRQRILRVVTSAVIILVALALILNSIIPVHTLLGLLARPTPTATLAPTLNIYHFYLDASPSWGKLSLDGHPLTFSTDEPLQLPRGRHQFVWQAEPFRTIRCTLSVPVTARDTCKHISIQSPTDSPPDEAQEVTFYDTLNMLPVTQQAALIQAAQAALAVEQSTTTVQPGEQFVHFVGSHFTDVATQPLHATLHFDLSVGNSHLENLLCANDFNMECFFLHRFQAQDVTQNCAWFCTEPDTYAPQIAPNSWQAVVIAHAYWDYATLDGRTIATDQPDTVLDLTNSAHFMFLNIVWDGVHWRATFNTLDAGGFNTLACLAANDEFSEVSPPVGLNSFGFSPVSTTVPALGCVEIVEPTAANPSAPAPVSSPQALCLYRFGIMLAANTTAHHYWPHMLVASAYEQSLARQLVASPAT